MVLMVIFRLIFVFLFVYLVWRKLRGEYQINDLLLYIWSTLLIFLVGGRVIFGIINFENWDSLLDWLLVWRVGGLSYIASLMLVIVWTGYYCYLKKWKFMLLAEETTRYFILFFMGNFLVEYLLAGMKIVNLGFAVICGILMILSIAVAKRYRSFAWYPSGKKGFIFWWVLLFFGLLSAVWVYILKYEWWITVSLVIFGLTSLVELLILGDAFKNLSIKKWRVKQ